MSVPEKPLFDAPTTIEVKSITVGGRMFSCPFADAMPLLKPEERAALKDNIRLHGIKMPIQIDEENNILDGHTRLEIAVELGLTETEIPIKVEAGLSDAQKRDFAENMNLHRRHLTSEEKRKVVVRRLKANPDQSDRAIGTGVGVDNKTVASVRKEMERTEEIPQLKVRSDRNGRRRSATKPSRSKSTATKPELRVFSPAAEETQGHDLAVDSTPPIQEPAAKSHVEIEPQNQGTQMLESANISLDDAGLLTCDQTENPPSQSQVLPNFGVINHESNGPSPGLTGTLPVAQEQVAAAAPVMRPKDWKVICESFAKTIRPLDNDAKTLRNLKVAKRKPGVLRDLVANVQDWADWAEREINTVEDEQRRAVQGEFTNKAPVVRSVGMDRAHEAISILETIPLKDIDRALGLNRVKNWARSALKDI